MTAVAGATLTEAARRALSNLRSTDHFQWYVVPLLLVVVYAYFSEVERRNWSVVLGGLAFWGMDWFNEIWNGLVLHFSNRAPVWGEPSGTAYLILVGLNIETCLMFALMGVASLKLLPADRRMRILGMPNRWFLALALSITAVVVELLLHAAGALTWDWPWWNVGSPIPIVLVGYLPFFVVAFRVHDLHRPRRQASAVGAILGFDATCLAVFLALGWI